MAKHLKGLGVRMAIAVSPYYGVTGPIGAGYYLWSEVQETLDALWSRVWDPELFEGEPPLPNVWITPAAPQTQQQLKGDWSPAQRREVDVARWISQKGQMLPPLPKPPSKLPSWILPAAIGLGAFLVLRR